MSVYLTHEACEIIAKWKKETRMKVHADLNPRGNVLISRGDGHFIERLMRDVDSTVIYHRLWADGRIVRSRAETGATP